MIRVLFFVLSLVALSFCDVIDRGGVLSSFELNHLMEMSNRIEEQSGKQFLLVYLSEEEEGNMARLSSGYSTELNITSEHPWVLALLSPSGKVEITVSSDLKDYFTANNLDTFRRMSSEHLRREGIAEGGENFLLHCWEVISHKETLDFSPLNSVPESEPSDDSEESSLWGLASLFIMIILFSSIRAFSKTLNSEQYEFKLWGGKISHTHQIYFGRSLRSGDR